MACVCVCTCIRMSRCACSHTDLCLKEKTMEKEIKELKNSKLEYNYIECIKGSDLLK